MKTAPTAGDPSFPRLKAWIIEQTGLGYYADKDEDLAARMAPRFTARGLSRCDEYLRLLMDEGSGPQELQALVCELTIGETYFFRQREQFHALRDTVLPDLLERNRATRQLRIWSAGCATGAETYSVALMLHLELAAAMEGWNISILGTDINRAFLARAQEGSFDTWAFREVPEDLKHACFERHGKSWVLLPKYRNWVSFQPHNMVSDAAPLVHGMAGEFDLILCRNVIIYFSAQAARTTVQRFYDALTPGGWLAVGHAEPNAELFSAYETVSSRRATLYRKTQSSSGRNAGMKLHVPDPIPVPFAPAAPAPRRRAEGRHRAAALPAKAPEPVAPARVEDVRRLADRGQWDAAAALCRALTEAQPLNAAAHFTMGLILEHTGTQDDAQESLRRAVYLDRRFALAHYHLGLCLQRQKAQKQARRAFQNTVDILGMLPPRETLEHGDGISAGELLELAKIHLELLHNR